MWQRIYLRKLIHWPLYQIFATTFQPNPLFAPFSILFAHVPMCKLLTELLMIIYQKQKYLFKLEFSHEDRELFGVTFRSYFVKLV